MTESNPPDKGKVHKIGSRSGTKAPAKKKRAQKPKQSTNSNDSSLLNELAQSLFSGLLSDEPQPASSKKKTAKATGNESANNLSQHVAFVSRGKAIGVRNLNTTHRIELITQAIANGVCLAGRYNRRERLLQPYGIVVREPKIYLLAVEYEENTRISKDKIQPVIKQYLCHRFEHMELTEQPYAIPDNFNVQDHIDSGALEQTVASLKSSLPGSFELVLKLHDAKKDNLLRDLEELPLGKQQSLINENDNGTYELMVPNQRATHELLEWILGRQERVEVIQPEALRQYVIGRIHAIAHRYIGDDQIAFLSNDASKTSQPKRKKASSKKSVAFPSRSKYITNENTNTVVTWMIVRLLSDMGINTDLIHDHKLQNIKSSLPKPMQNNLSKSTATLFAKAVKKLLTEQKEPVFDESDPFTRNTNDIAELLKLSDEELAIWRVSALLDNVNNLHEVSDLYIPNVTEYSVHTMVALLTNQSAEQVEYLLRDDQNLRRCGLIIRCPFSILNPRDVVKPNTAVAANLFLHHPENSNILSALLNRSSPALTTEADLEHLSTQVEISSRLIEGAVSKGIAGTNILLWGQPGTGKTQLARYLGQSLGLHTYEVPSTTSNRKALTETERFSSYQLSQSLLAHSGQAVLIFDEIENIIDAPYFVESELPKAYINQALDENPIPSIWISNQISSADPAYLRRFDYAIEIKTPDIKAKRRIASRILGSLPIDGELLDDFLERQEVGPALLTKLKRVADISGAEDQETVNALALSIVQGDLAALGAPALARNIKSTAKGQSVMQYDPAMINTDIDVKGFAKNLHTEAGVRLCLYGPPGTGKTAWAKQLAKDLNKPAHVKQLSDIKNKFVGESEANVASAFANALQEDAVLIFDEVDSYLRDRQNANQKHEADLVNQFLTSLENHDGIVVCSTNFMEAIDDAAVRRFDYKIKFDYLQAEQANALLLQLATLSGIDIDLKELRKNSLTLPAMTLAPGDFAAILRRSQSSAHEMTIEEIHAALLAEAEFRSPVNGKRIGFV